MKGLRVATALGAVLLGLLVIAGIVIGGWQLGWWFKAQNVKREAKVLRSSYGFQQSLRERVSAHIGDVTDLSSSIAYADPSVKPALVAQRQALGNQVCQEAEQVQGGLPPDQADWVAAHCSVGHFNNGGQ